MPEDDPYLLRQRLVETIVPLAAPAEQLVAYAHDDGVDIDDPVMWFVGWTYDFIPQLSELGLLPSDLPEQLQLVFDQAIAAVKSAPTEPCETAVMYPEWTLLRNTARAVLERFAAAGVAVAEAEAEMLGHLPEADQLSPGAPAEA